MQKAVLVDYRKAVKYPQRMEDFWVIPSVIRLKPIDKCEAVVADALKLTEPSAPSLRNVLVGVKKDGELSVCPWLPTVMDNEFPQKMVQSRAQAIKHFTDSNRPRQGRARITNIIEEDCLSRIAVYLSTEGIGVSFQEGGAIHHEGFELFLYPLDLGESAAQWLHLLQSDHGEETENPKGRAIPSMDAPSIPAESRAYFQNSHHFFSAFGAAGISAIGSGAAAAPTYFDGSASNAVLQPTAQK
jgi:hypothetical protein